MGEVYGYLGFSLEVGDVDGDGTDDLVVSAPTEGATEYGGAAYLFYGPLDGAMTPSDADARLVGGGRDQAFGVGLLVTDLNDDAIDDITVGAPYGGPPAVYTLFGRGL